MTTATPSPFDKPLPTNISALEAFGRNILAIPLISTGLLAFPVSVTMLAGIGNHPVLAPAAVVGGLALGAVMLATGVGISSLAVNRERMDERKALNAERKEFLAEAKRVNADAIDTVKDEAVTLTAGAPWLRAA